jgi:hypothetical protein
MHAAFCLLIVSTIAPTATEDPKPAERFAGQWVVRSVEVNGATEEARMPADSALLTIRGNRIEFFIVTLGSSYEETGKFTVVEDGRDRFKVDVRVVEKSGSDLGRQPDRGIVRKELWRITGAGKLQRRMPRDPSGARPESFSTKKGDGVDIMTFERK